MPQMKVLLADDHPIVLMGVREIIERDPRFKVVGEAMSSSELIDKISQLNPDVIITDYNMPGDEQYGDGTRLVEYLRRHFPGPRVLILTVISNPQVLNWLYELGISGVISKAQGLSKSWWRWMRFTVRGIISKAPLMVHRVMMPMAFRKCSAN